MNDIENRIQDLVSNFVNEITRLAREAAVDTLSRALSGAGPASSPSAGRPGRPRAAAAAAAVTAAPSAPAANGGARRSKGAKRPKSEIAEIQERVHAHIKANPGQRIEQINKILGTRTSDLTLPLKKLIADNSIITKGARRATTYLPGDGSGAGGKKRRPRGK